MNHKSVQLALAKHARYESTLTPLQQSRMLNWAVLSTETLGELLLSDSDWTESYRLEIINENLKAMASFRLNYTKKLRDEFGDLERSLLDGDCFENRGWLFITIGFDDKVACPADMKRIIKKVKQMKGMKWESFRYVHEKHRKDKDGKIYHHLHTHILARTPYPKSKLLQYLYPKTCKSFLEPVVAGKNFVDVRTPKDGDTFSGKLRYIEGDKTESKLECVALDVSWRNENGLNEEI